jgi:hypothetical protein
MRALGDFPAHAIQILLIMQAAGMHKRIRQQRPGPNDERE